VRTHLANKNDKYKRGNAQRQTAASRWLVRLSHNRAIPMSSTRAATTRTGSSIRGSRDPSPGRLGQASAPHARQLYLCYLTEFFLRVLNRRKGKTPARRLPHSENNCASMRDCPAFEFFLATVQPLNSRLMLLCWKSEMFFCHTQLLSGADLERQSPEDLNYVRSKS